MQRRSAWLGAALLATIAFTAVAVAASLKGKTYRGYSARKGKTSSGAPVLFGRHGLAIDLRVAASGKTVKVSLTGASPKLEVLYCNTGIDISKRTTSPAVISRSGTFTAVLHDTLPDGIKPVKQVVTGKFSGRKVSGTIRTEAITACSGSVAYFASVN